MNAAYLLALSAASEVDALVIRALKACLAALNYESPSRWWLRGNGGHGMTHDADEGKRWHAAAETMARGIAQQHRDPAGWLAAARAEAEALGLDVIRINFGGALLQVTKSICDEARRQGRTLAGDKVTSARRHCARCGGLRGVICGGCEGEGCAACDGRGHLACPICDPFGDEWKTRPAAAIPPARNLRTPS